MKHLPRLLFALLAPCAPAAAQDLVAHRGASYDAPENTLAAFNLAWQDGADGVEGDFYLSADGHIVCIHDGDTERTAGVRRVVAESTLAELRELDVGSWKSAEFADERIPTLEEVLATVPAGKYLLIEVKCGPEIVPAIERVLAASDLEPGQVKVIAFNAEVIAACKQRMPHLQAYWLTGHGRDEVTGKWSNTLEEVLPTLKRIRADGLDTSVPPELFDGDFVRGLRDAKLQVHTWTVNDLGTAARLYWLGVDSITTDRPAYLRSLLPKRGLRDRVLTHLSLDEVEHGVAGVYGQAVDLKARSGPLRVDRKLPERGSLTLWHRPRAWYDHQTILDSPADANGWEMWIYASGLLRFRAHPHGAILSHQFHPTGDANEWHHVALTWDRMNDTANALQLFVNGHLAQSSAWSSRGWFEAGEHFYLGGGHSGNTPGLGLLDEVTLFDVPLTAGEVRFLMSAAVNY